MLLDHQTFFTMDKILIRKKNETYLSVEADRNVLYEMQDHFSFYMDGYKYHPKVKAGIWDGIIKLLDLRYQHIYVGLLPEIKKFCKDRDYRLEFGDSKYGMPDDETDVTPKEIHEFVNGLNFHSDGDPITFRSYQLQAIYLAIKNNRRTLISPTGSGKSAIIAAITRWFTEQEKRVLIVTITTALVDQMKEDFIDYHSHSRFNAEKNIHTIMAGKSKDSDKDIVISTWQSLMKAPSEWLNEFDVIIVDEVHSAAAKELTGMMERATDVKYRFGLTGSLGKSKTNEMVIRGLHGEVSRVAKTKDLIDKGFLSNIDIKCVIMNYPKDISSLFSKKQDYQKEVDFLVSYEERNKFISKLALSLEGNTLILYNYVEKHGQVIFDKINDLNDDESRTIHFIHGDIKADERNDIRKLIENADNDIVVASAGTTSTGTNIKRVHNIILAHPYKSPIKIVQSIGRGLRVAKDKKHLQLFDLSDRLNKSKTKPNHTFRHCIERLKIYSEEEFNYRIINVELK